ncbi:MAG: hypothetical protein ABSF62_03440 [Bryobacteraceae bacterium]|jgi:hypothetical protein
MKIGAENKMAVWALSVLGVVAAYGVYANFFSGPSVAPAPSARTRAMDAIPEAVAVPDNSKSAPQRPAVRGQVQEFRPVLRPKKKEDQIVDIRTVDPTIRLDWLARVQEVPQAGGERDLFQILKAPPVHEAVLKGDEPHVFIPRGPPAPPPPPGPPPDPNTVPPPPIPLKYYGFCTERNNGKKTAYFLDNDEIIQATEGTTLKGRYRVVRIGLNQVVMEDVQSKRQQNLTLEPEMAG